MPPSLPNPQALRERIERRLRRFARGVRSRVTPPRAQLVYHPGYRAPDNPLSDARRAQRVVHYLIDAGCLHPSQLLEPRRATLQQLLRVHPIRYLERVAEREGTSRVFGDLIDLPALDALIEQHRLMTGGSVLAAHTAWRERQVVVNLGGGFHHASREEGAGFCLVNDIAIAVASLRARGFSGRVLVLDLDLHPGDGTRRVFAEDTSVFTASLHAVDWDLETSAVADWSRALGAAIGDEAFDAALHAMLAEVFDAARPELVIYVAGVDGAFDDRLGSWRLSADALLARDRAVLDAAEGLPLVWLLAGGYGPEAWRYTARSLADRLAGYDAPIASLTDTQLARFRRIARDLSAERLGAEEGQGEADEIRIELGPEDVLGDLTDHAPRRLLNVYSRYGVELALERYGVLAILRAQGFEGVCVRFDLEHASGQRVLVESDDARADLLIELVLAPTRRDELDLLSVEWMMLQNPRARPDPERPLLPGQDHPGLGCLNEIVGMLVITCERLGLDGLLFRPAHFHVAVFSRGLAVFLEPRDEARFIAFQAALEGLPLREASAAIARGEVVDAATGEPVAWPASRVISPVSERCEARFSSPDYAHAVEAAAMEVRLRRAPGASPAGG